MKKKLNSLFLMFKQDFSKIGRLQKRIYKLQRDTSENQEDLRLKLAREILARISHEATLAFLTSSYKDKNIEKSLIEILVDRWHWSGHGERYSEEFCFHKSKVIAICKEFEINPDKFMRDLNINCSDVSFSYHVRSSGRICIKLNFK